MGLEQRKREYRGSSKDDYKIETTVTQIKKDSDRWLFEVFYSEHNHFPSFDPNAHYEIRNIYKNKAFRKRVIDNKRIKIHAK